MPSSYWARFTISFFQEERCQAVNEALRVLRQDGVLFAGFITLYANFRDAIAKGYLKDFVENPEWAENILTGRAINPGFTDVWFTKPSEVQPWMESFGLKTLALFASEGLVAGHEQHINTLDQETFGYWAGLNYQFCSDPHLYRAADHLLYLGRLPLS